MQLWKIYMKSSWSRVLISKQLPALNQTEIDQLRRKVAILEQHLTSLDGLQTST